MRRSSDPPIVLVKWYDAAKWILERVDNFPKNQRFIFGQRLADRALTVMELLVEAAYSRNKQRLLERANREIEVLRWLVRMATDRGLLTKQQYLHCCGLLAECGSMVGGWLKQVFDVFRCFGISDCTGLAGLISQKSRNN